MPNKKAFSSVHVHSIVEIVVNNVSPYSNVRTRSSPPFQDPAIPNLISSSTYNVIKIRLRMEKLQIETITADLLFACWFLLISFCLFIL